MSAPTLHDKVLDQVIAEGPFIEDETEQDDYAADIINSWSNVELLARISDALKKTVKKYER